MESNEAKDLLGSEGGNARPGEAIGHKINGHGYNGGNRQSGGSDDRSQSGGQQGGRGGYENRGGGYEGRGGGGGYESRGGYEGQGGGYDRPRTGAMEVAVENNLEKAMKLLKRKLIREGLFKELKMRRFFEKPCERRKRKLKESIKKVRKEENRSKKNLGLM